MDLSIGDTCRSPEWSCWVGSVTLKVETLKVFSYSRSGGTRLFSLSRFFGWVTGMDSSLRGWRDVKVIHIPDLDDINKFKNRRTESVFRWGVEVGLSLR